MKKIYRTFLKITAILALSPVMATHAAIPHVPLVPAARHIENLSATLATIQKKSSLPVLFPQQIPRSLPEKLFATGNVYSTAWFISIGKMKGCHVKSCEMGSMSASHRTLEKEYLSAPFNPPKHFPKEAVKLVHHLIGYYTPAHAEADWHPATLEWQMHDTLYQIAWHIPSQDKAVLVRMANSAILSKSKS